MNRFTLIWRNLWRKPLRTVFTMLAVLVVFFLFTLLQGFRVAFSLSGLASDENERLMSMHKVSLIMFLPIAYETRMERLPGVDAVAHATWFGASYQDNPEFGQYPVDAEDYLGLYPELSLPEAQRDAWLANRGGAIVGRMIANQYGWEVGQRVPLKSSIWSRNDGSDIWEFDIEGIFEDSSGGDNSAYMLFHYDYFEEARSFAKGTVGWYVTRGDGSRSLTELVGDIDAEFANSPAETKTKTEAAFAAEYAKQFGDIGMIVTLILTAVVFMILLVTGHTMAQSVRERVHELGVLKTLGFTSPGVLGLIISEGLLLVAPVGLLGILLGVWALEILTNVLGAMLPTGLNLSLGALLLGLALIAGIGLFAVLPPTVRALRMDIVALLRAT